MDILAPCTCDLLVGCVSFKNFQGGKVSRKRIETTISRTAEWTCVSRAASSLEYDSHYRSGDHIALLLVPTFMKLLLRISLVRRFFRHFISPKGIYEYTIARTKYIDAVFKVLEELENHKEKDDN